jgi:hypothetical protein
VSEPEAEVAKNRFAVASPSMEIDPEPVVG